MLANSQLRDVERKLDCAAVLCENAAKPSAAVKPTAEEWRELAAAFKALATFVRGR